MDGTKTETLLLDSLRRVTEVEKQCIREEERYLTMSNEIKEMKDSIKELFKRITEMEKNWRVLIVLVSLAQMIVIPLIIKFIIK